MGASSTSNIPSSTLFLCLLYLSLRRGVSSCFAFTYWVVVPCLLLHGSCHSLGGPRGLFAVRARLCYPTFLVYRCRQHHSFIRIPHFSFLLSAFLLSRFTPTVYPLFFRISLLVYWVCGQVGGWADGVLCRFFFFFACRYTSLRSIHLSPFGHIFGLVSCFLFVFLCTLA